MTLDAIDRRALLKPAALAGVVRTFLPASGPAADLLATPHLLRIGRRAMACHWEVVVPASERARIGAIVSALDAVQDLEHRLTAFDVDSEIGAINRNASSGGVRLEPDLFALLRACLDLHRETSGAFDIAGGALSRCWGFLSREGRVPGPREHQTALRRTGSHHLHLDEASRTIEIDEPGVELNLGAIGKGYALDRAARHLRQAGVRDALLHAGYSSILALGDAPGQPARAGWLVTVRNPFRRGPLAAVRLRGMAMGVSGVAEQQFECGGRRYGHVLDPRTGWPAGVHVMAVAIAPTAALADGLSTAFFVMQPGEVEAYCARHADTGALLVPAAPEDEGRPYRTVGRATECVEDER